jgi:putative transposase
LKARLRTVFEANDTETARKLAKGIHEEYADKAARAVETLDQGVEDAIAVLALPEYYRRKLRTTNSVERLNEEIRRRERVIRIFPNPESAVRLIGAVLNTPPHLDKVQQSIHLTYSFAHLNFCNNLIYFFP